MTRTAELCERYADALVDAKAPRPVGMDEHVRSCAQCGALLAAHRAAAIIVDAAVRRRA